MRSAIVIAALFAAVAVALLGTLPLWLDEVLQLLETRSTTPAQMLTTLPRNSGAAPLGYLAQQASLRITGFGRRRARIPALIFGVASVLAVALLAAQMGLARPWLAALIFAAFPATLRYAVEARIYSQGLFFSILAAIFYLRLAKQPDLRRATLYSLALALALYSQPYTIFIGFALLLWSIIVRDFRAARFGAIAFVAAGIAFLPWYLWSKSEWAAGIARQGFFFSMSARTPLMLFREIPGAGYWGSGAILLLCIAALLARRIPARTPAHTGWLLLLMIFVPLVGGLAADASAGYFIAARQFLWMLPAIAILAASAFDVSRASLPLFAALIFICGLQSAKYFTAPHEDWEAAAANAVRYARSTGACIATNPPDYLRILGFFQPELLHCSGASTIFAIPPAAKAP